MDHVFSSSSSTSPTLSTSQHAKVDARAEERKKERDQKKEAKVRAYIHPKTYNIYGNSHPVDAGCFLFPLQVISNDDSNLVRWQLVPNLLATAMFALMRGGSSSAAQAVQGDGTVDEKSANPSKEQLSHNFKQTSSVAGTHLTMPSSEGATSVIQGALNDIVQHWDS
jgi:hypothetical protein